MEIAVSVNLKGRFVDESKAYDGGLTNYEILSLNALACLKLYPEDRMLLCHGMLYRANRNSNYVTINGRNGNVLFAARLNGACYDGARVIR